MTASLDPKAFLDELQHEDWRVRKRALARLGDLLPSMERGARFELATAVVERLGREVEPHARTALAELATRLPEEVGALAAQRIGTGDSAELVFVDLLQRIGSPRHVPLLAGIARRTDADLNVRAAAVAALGAVGGDEAVAALDPLLEKAEPFLRVHVLDALARSGAVLDEERLDPHLEALETRRAALEILARGRPERAFPRVMAHVGDAVGAVRRTAVIAASRLVEGVDGERPPSWVASVSPKTRDVLRRMLEGSPVEVQRAAMHLLAVLDDEDAATYHVPALSDPVVFEHASQLVARQGDRVVARLRQALADCPPGHRADLLRLVGALGRPIQDADLVRALAEGVDDPDEETATAAAEALAVVGDRPVVGPLYHAMGREGVVGEAAADALAHVLLRISEPNRDELDVLVGPKWPIAGALARNLCRVAARLGRASHVEHLVALLGSAESEVRMAAAAALAHIPGAQAAAAALTIALADEVSQVRAAACRSLGALKAPEGIEPLLGATRDASPTVRAAAVAALSALGNPVALPRLREIILEDPVPAVVVQAVMGLGASQTPRDRALLLALATSEDDEVLKATARALAHHAGHRVTAALLGMLEHARWDVRWAAAESLGVRGDRTALESLRRYLEREDDDLVRAALAEALDRLEAPALEDS